MNTQNFIGPKAVANVVVLEWKTPNGDEMLHVFYDDGTNEKVSKKRFELLSLSKVSTYSEMAKVLTGRIAATIYGLLHEYDVRWGEVNAVFQAVSDLTDNGLEKATNILFDTDSKLEIPLNKINEILTKEHARQKDSDGTPSTGSGVDTENKE